jgi:hypothetical protein
MTWVLSVTVEVVEVEQSALNKQQGHTIKRGLTLRPFQVSAESIWDCWQAAEQKVTDDLFAMLEPPPLSLGVH